ncbi:MAG: acyl-phosphate glycerol 3-phosphate acyltransferase, partial [Gammaproteobacteria bacterium SG8_47]
TYQALWDNAVAVAGGLQRQGIEPGHAVAIMLPTSPDYFPSFFGVLLAGAVPVPIYPPVRRSQLEEHLRRHRGILNNCTARALITVPEAQVVAKLLRSQVESLQTVVSPPELRDAASPYQTPAISEQDIAFIQYTSGSTGSPKGVVLSHANLLANIRAMGDATQASSEDVFVSWLPLYHDMGLIGAWLGSLYYAASFVVMSPLSFLLRPQRWLWAIHDHHATLSAAPNFGYELCLKRPQEQELEGLDLSSWRLAFNGAEPVSPETIRRFAARFASHGFQPEVITPVYGLAESAVGLAFPPLGRGPLIDRVQRERLAHDGQALPAADADSNALEFVACGQPLPGHEIRIVDDAGRELPDRQEGHVQFRGPSVTRGYYHNPDKSRELFQNGWANSGDLGYIASGDLYITGRSKDIIIRAGRNIYPHELEEVIGDIDGVRKGCVAVFASTDPRTGTERLVVLAETRELGEDRRARLQELITEATTKLIDLPPDEVVLGPPHTVLKTSSGKIRRAACRTLFEDGQLRHAGRSQWLQMSRLLFHSIRPSLRRLRRKVLAGAYAAYAWSVYGILAPLGWLAGVALPSLELRWRALRALARALRLASLTPLTVDGLSNIPKRGTPCVIVANHASYLDPYLMVAVMPRPVAFVAKAEFMDKFVPRVFLHRVRAEFAERFDVEKGTEDARRLAEVSRRGRTLFFFPEGTFTRVPGLLPFRMGAFLAAAQAGAPLVPIAIRGTRSILRAHSWFPRRGAITVSIGAPVDTAALKSELGDDDWAIAVRLRDMARDHMLRHCGEPDLGGGGAVTATGANNTTNAST